MENRVTVITLFDKYECLYKTYCSLQKQKNIDFQWLIIAKMEDKMELGKIASLDNRILLHLSENSDILEVEQEVFRQIKSDYIFFLPEGSVIGNTWLEELLYLLYFNPKFKMSCVLNKICATEENINFFMIKKDGLCQEISIKESIKKWNQIIYIEKTYEDKKCRELKNKWVGESILINTYVPGLEFINFEDMNYLERFKLIRQVEQEETHSLEQREKISILLLTQWLEIGGADAFNLEFVKRVNKEKFDVRVITTQKSVNVWKYKFEDEVEEIMDLSCFLKKSDYIDYILKFIETRNIDIVFISNSYIAYYFLPYIKKRFPKVVCIDFVHTEEWYWRNGGFARISGIMGGLLSKSFTGSVNTRKVLTDVFNRKNVEQVYVGVDTDIYKNKGIGDINVRSRFNDKKIILYIARLNKEKRPLLMLEIAKQLIKIRRDIVFLVVGDGPEFNKMQKFIAKEKLEDFVVLEGYQDNLIPYYESADISLICTLVGITFVTYQSLAMGLPVVSSSSGGQDEVITNDVGRVIQTSVKEYEIDVDEVNQYVSAIEELLSSEEKLLQMKSNCRLVAQERFSINQTVFKLEQEFIKLSKKESVEESQSINEIDFEPLQLYALYEETESNWEKAKKYYLDQIDSKEKILKSQGKFIIEFEEAKKYFLSEISALKEAKQYHLGQIDNLHEAKDYYLKEISNKDRELHELMEAKRYFLDQIEIKDGEINKLKEIEKKYKIQEEQIRELKNTIEKFNYKLKILTEDKSIMWIMKLKKINL
ncbi:hypothetical protein C3V36_01235 [Lachnospiraceae bacterium oral taxon 500]|nr:hypothetical protein C3V36_01235 [Lachnospiraceae bacterium oral taxon 500]